MILEHEFLVEVGRQGLAFKHDLVIAANGAVGDLEYGSDLGVGGQRSPRTLQPHEPAMSSGKKSGPPRDNSSRSVGTAGTGPVRRGRTTRPRIHTTPLNPSRYADRPCCARVEINTRDNGGRSPCRTRDCSALQLPRRSPSKLHTF